MSNIFQGKRIRLRGLEAEDWEYFYKADQDSETGRLTDEVWLPNSEVRARTWAEDMAQSQMIPRDDYYFVIETLEGEMVGTINIHTTNPRCGTFRYGLAIHPDHRRQGYASEAVRLVLGYYFNERRYQKVNVEIYSFNAASIRLHDHLGFMLEGCLRRMVYTRGEYHDALVYGMTKEEFKPY